MFCVRKFGTWWGGKHSINISGGRVQPYVVFRQGNDANIIPRFDIRARLRSCPAAKVKNYFLLYPTATSDNVHHFTNLNLSGFTPCSTLYQSREQAGRILFSAMFSPLIKQSLLC
jgi:hypothetical protein